jgi:hypothetical protein
MSATLAVVVLALNVVLASALGQPAVNIARVGFLTPLDRSAPHFEAFRQRLADFGYIEGRNIALHSSTR